MRSMGDIPAVAVIGAGNVGCALAADLALRGIEVRLFGRSQDRLQAIREAGRITVTGELNGDAVVSLVTESLTDAIDRAGVVVVCVPTLALPTYAAALGSATTADQVVCLNPGHTGGALYLNAHFARHGFGPRKLCQLTTASHVSRIAGPATVRVFLVSRAAVAALPSHFGDECHERLDQLLPGQFGKAASILELDLANVNAIMHPPGMVCDAGWIDATGGQFRFYAEGAGPPVIAVMEAVDRERLELAEALSVSAVPFPTLFTELGFVDDASNGDMTIAEALERSELIHPIMAPATLDHRYLHEDVGWGLVPWAHLADAVGCSMPTINAIIHLAGLLNGTDYAREGLTLARMGLADMSADAINRHVVGSRTGSVEVMGLEPTTSTLRT